MIWGGRTYCTIRAEIITKESPETSLLVIFLGSFSSFFLAECRVFCNNYKTIASKNNFCKKCFCNNFGHDGRVRPPDPVLEASEIGIGLVCARSL